MRCEWRPETPEEIAEHQRMRRELMECQQMQDEAPANEKTTHAHFPSVFVVCAVIFLVIYFIFNR